MATILQFRPTAEAKARIESPAEGTLGEIIIFPGVRIERRSPAEVPPQRVPARRRAQPSRKK